jgi:hypothetical protein
MVTRQHAARHGSEIDPGSSGRHPVSDETTMNHTRRTTLDARAAGSSSPGSAALAVLAVVTANLALFAIPAVILLAPTRKAEAEPRLLIPEPTPYVVPVSLAMGPAPVRVATPLPVADRKASCAAKSHVKALPVRIARPAASSADPHS